MSADNWAICPRCVNAPNDQPTAIPPTIDPESCRTFREDYEFYGAEDGEVTADYSGHCTKCGLGIDFKVTRPIPGL